MAVNSLQGPLDAVIKTLIDAKGDLIVGTADNTIDKLSVGNNNYIFVADSSTATGIKWSNILNNLITLGLEERCNVVASAATGTINLDFLTASVWFYTTNASANHTLNIRGNSTNSLSSLLAVGDSITVVWMNTNGTTAYYPNTIQIDGSTITPKWQGGVAPSAGNASAIDVYTFTIIKTNATPTYTVLGTQIKFS